MQGLRFEPWPPPKKKKSNLNLTKNIKKLADYFYHSPFVLFILQEEELNKVVINPINAKEFERPFNSHGRLNDHAEKSSLNNQVKDPLSSKLDSSPNNSGSASSSGEDQNLKL